MRKFYSMGKRIEQALENLNKECDKALDSTCKLEQNLLGEQYWYTQQNLEKIYPKNRVRKSICEWCGTVLHFLYGTVDANEAREIMEVINNSSNAIIENRKMINHTTHIIEATLGEEENRVNKIQDSLNSWYANIQTSINDKLKRRDIISITRSLINEYKTLVESIDQAFAISKGQTPKIVRTVDFKTQMQRISKAFKPGKRFPIDVFADDILEIFNFATIKSRRVENKILLKITLPICEIETYRLFKVTPVPIITENFCLIANMENSYFMINKEKTEFTELTIENVENGIRMNDNNVLYKVNALTKTNPNSNCIWSQFMDNDINLLTTNCNLSPILKHNYITTITDNDLFYLTVVKPLIVWETCEDEERKYHINVTGFLQSKPNCLITTDDFIIKNHDNIKLNFTVSIQPFRYGGSFSIKEFENITKALPDLDIAASTTMIDSKSTIAKLRGETGKLIESANKKLYLKKLEHASAWFTFSFSFSFKSYIIMGSIMMLALMLVCTYYCQCMSFGCLCNLLKKEKKEKTESIKLKSKDEKSYTKYRKTPYVGRRNIEKDLEMGNESN